VKPAKPCCPSFAKAFEPYTDNEGYRSLFDATFPEVPGTIEVGSSDLPPINFCPWCGVSVAGIELFDPFANV
jgi:hypothetical protein